MALYKTYQGSFVSRMGHTVRCEIWCEASKAPASVGELTFPYESPLTIEWDSDSKRETIQGSTATLTVESPGDRTYIGLYTTVAGSVQLRVYRDNALWWSGTLDPEHYEEPFSMQKNYDVTFTFTDFGILDRLKYELTGVQSIDAIVKNGISRAKIVPTTYTSYIGTTADGETARLWTVRSDNFTDEDGETMTVREVMEAVMEPLDLHVRQWKGVVYVYDLHTISGRTALQLTWLDDGQTMSVDEVANSVRVTFSPYANATVMDEDGMKYVGKVSTSDYESAGQQGFLAYAGGTSADGAKTHAWYPDYGDRSNGQSDQDYQNLSFGLYTTSDASKMDGVEYVSPSVKVGKILPLLGGNEADIIVQGYWYSGHTHQSSESKQYNGTWQPGSKLTDISQSRLFAVSQGNVGADTSGRSALRISMELLYDPRYNFETAAGEENERGNNEQFTKKSSTIYVPVRIYVRDGAGNVLCHYKNSDRCQSADVDMYFNRDTYSSNTDGWVSGAPTGTTAATWECWLCYYKTSDDRAEDGGMDGWTGNSHAIGFRSTGKFAESFKARNEGEILPMPPHGGQLVIEVYRGVYVYDYKVNLNWGEDSTLSSAWLSENIRWHAYKCPGVTIVNRDLKHSEIEGEDIEYGGVLIESAQDEISIDTKCGSAANVPGARGVYMTSVGVPIATAKRNNRTASVEQLLIGTVHSHYASRHVKLTGTIELGANAAIAPMYDGTLGSSIKLLMTSCTCDLRADEIDATLIETSKDSYTSV